jgi:hypothetical protein
MGQAQIAHRCAVSCDGSINGQEDCLCKETEVAVPRAYQGLLIGVRAAPGAREPVRLRLRVQRQEGVKGLVREGVHFLEEREESTISRSSGTSILQSEESAQKKKFFLGFGGVSSFFLWVWGLGLGLTEAGAVALTRRSRSPHPQPRARGRSCRRWAWGSWRRGQPTRPGSHRRGGSRRGQTRGSPRSGRR